GSPAFGLVLVKPVAGSVYTAGGPADVIGFGGYHQPAAADPVWMFPGAPGSKGFAPCEPSMTATLPHSARRPTLRVLVKSMMVWRALLMHVASQPVNVVPSQCGVQKFWYTNFVWPNESTYVWFSWLRFCRSRTSKASKM